VRYIIETNKLTRRVWTSQRAQQLCGIAFMFMLAMLVFGYSFYLYYRLYADRAAYSLGATGVVLSGVALWALVGYGKAWR
jgi:hypothetical protein